MSYEVQFQHEGAEYIVRGPDIDGVLRLIQGVQRADDKSDYERCQEAAVTTLRRLKYEWRGGEQWTPPIGPAPAALWYPDDSGAWVECAGCGIPVPPTTTVEVLTESERAEKSYSIGSAHASSFPWENLVAYKVVTL